MLIYSKIDKLFEGIADGSATPQRFSTMPTSVREKKLKKEGGKAFKNYEGELLASSIKKEYVPYTLKQVYNLLERLGFIDMGSVQPLGSTFHLSKPMLGDLDILIKPNTPLDLNTFKSSLYDKLYLEGFTIRDLAEKGRDFLFDEFSFLFPIIDDNNQDTGQQVQVDLLLAENDVMYDWRYYWYSSPKVSAWKGAARNVLLGIIASKRGYSWTKNGLFQKKMIHDWERSILISDNTLEAVKEVFGDNADISIIDSVETMIIALDTQSVLTPLKTIILSRFKEIVRDYESQDREMRNK
jgi:hypothetical protein